MRAPVAAARFTPRQAAAMVHAAAVELTDAILEVPERASASATSSGAPKVNRRGSTGGGAASGKRAHGGISFLIGVAGGTASGKTTVCDQIMQRLHDSCVVMISQDSFYRVLNEDEKKLANAGSFNFDAPEAFDKQLLVDTIRQLKVGPCVAWRMGRGVLRCTLPPG
jgi:hypothetical protein